MILEHLLLPTKFSSSESESMALLPLTKVIILVSVGVGLGCIGTVLYIVFPAIMKAAIENKLYLVEGTIGYKYWKDIPVPIYLNIYFFNITNTEDVYALKSKPIVEEIGPYVFREERTKINIGWNENGTLSYRQEKRWYFRSDLSNGSLNDNITQINTVMMMAAAIAKNINSTAFDILVALALTTTESTWFIQKSAREFLFEGYTDELFNISRIFETLPFKKFGWFYGRNGSDDGVMTVFTGTSDINRLDELDKCNGLRHTSAYDPPCNMVNGTAGDLFSPFRKKSGEKISFFVPDICRSIYLTYLETRQLNGIDGFRYWADDTLFDNGRTNPANKCFCNKGNCLPPGALDVSGCKFGAPATVSYPHFLFADSFYTKGVIGLKPDPQKHTMYMDIQPNMGIPLSVAARIQINILFENNPRIAQFQNVTGRTYIPVFWFSNTAILDDDITAVLKTVLKTLPLAVNITSFFLIGIGALLIIIAFIYAALFVNGKKESVAKTEKRDLATTEPLMDNT